MTATDLRWFGLMIVSAAAAIAQAIGGHSTGSFIWIVFAFLTSIVWGRSDQRRQP
jgi:hypothetical protein